MAAESEAARAPGIRQRENRVTTSPCAARLRASSSLRWSNAKLALCTSCSLLASRTCQVQPRNPSCHQALYRPIPSEPMQPPACASLAQHSAATTALHFRFEQRRQAVGGSGGHTSAPGCARRARAFCRRRRAAAALRRRLPRSTLVSPPDPTQPPPPSPSPPPPSFPLLHLARPTWRREACCSR